jgi:hypothetical protein
MKRSERHRLKENELSHAFSEASVRLAENRRKYGTLAVAVLAVLLGAVGYWAWTTRRESHARERLTEAITIMQSAVDEPKAGAKPPQSPVSYPTMQARGEAALPKFTEVFDSYPSTEAGIAARYYAASTLVLLGRPAEAVTRYQEVVDRAGAKSFYGRMARLGLIEASVLTKQFDQAVTTAQSLVNDTTDDTIPRDALLMELGRAYAAAGKRAEAKEAFDKVITEFPDSPYLDEAKQLLSTVT